MNRLENSFRRTANIRNALRITLRQTSVRSSKANYFAFDTGGMAVVRTAVNIDITRCIGNRSGTASRLNLTCNFNGRYRFIIRCGIGTGGFHRDWLRIRLVVNENACLIQAGGNKRQSGFLICLNGLVVIRQVHAVKYNTVPNLAYCYIIYFQICIRFIRYCHGRRIIRRNRAGSLQRIRCDIDGSAACIEMIRQFGIRNVIAAGNGNPDCS